MSVRPAVLAWSDLILSAIEGTPLDPALVAGLIDKESEGIPTALNQSGAAGLMQVKLVALSHLVIPTVYKMFGMTLTYPKGEATLQAFLFEPELNVTVGVTHLSWCVRSCGDEAKGLARYHTGYCLAGEREDSAKTKTRDYVADIMTLRNEYAPHFAPPREDAVPTLTKPVTYDVRNDAHAARFGLTPAERNTLLTYRIPGRRGNSPKAIVLHIQEGVTHGSLDWWVNGWVNGQKVTASASVMAQKDGSLLRVINDDDGPWTNGDVKSPTPKASALLSLGRDPNVFSLTIEAEGRPDVPLTPQQVNAIAWQVQEWQAGFPIPNHMVMGHGAINSVDRAFCGTYRDQIMNHLGGGETPSIYVPADVPNLGPWDGQDRDLNGTHLYACRRMFTVTDKTPVTRYASGGGELRPPMVKDDYFMGDYVLFFNRAWFALTPFGSRINLTHCTPKVTFEGGT